jgi:hypothetical protein
MGAWQEEIDNGRHTFIEKCFIYMLSVSSKQWVDALYPLLDYPDMLLSAGQSLMVMNNNAHRLKCSCLCAFHILTAYAFHNNRRL